MTRAFRTMRDGVTAFAILALIWLISAKLNDQPETVHSGRLHAADGDSLAADGERMRLYGIDAPELAQTCERGGQRWPCGREAQAMLQRLVAPAGTQCGGNERDRFDRLLVVCRVDGADINAEMVRRGMAVSYGGYREEETQARAAQAGLWAGTFERPRDVRDHAQQRSLPQRVTGFFGWP